MQEVELDKIKFHLIKINHININLDPFIRA